eukprot:scaffold370_cov192-Alexandrium_tamarense.AAC.2
MLKEVGNSLAEVLTRSSCREGSQPDGMRKDHWDMLCSYRFGTIIFGTPENNQTPMPNLIADGDLDGDRKSFEMLFSLHSNERTNELNIYLLRPPQVYFVLWEPTILDHLQDSKTLVGIKSRKILRKLTLPKQQKKSLVNKSNDVSKAGGGGNWLRKAQEQMLDFSKQQAESTLVSTFYRKCFECSKQDNGMHDIYNEDACAFAYAYKDAMDIQKHGGKIYLPEHLHQQVTPTQRELLGT